MIKPALIRTKSPAESSQLKAEQAMRRFGSALGSHMSDRLLRLNLSIPQLRVIKTIDRMGRVSGRQLADEFGVSPAAIVPVCDRLEGIGLLRRVRDTDDRRICWFELTESGARTLDIVSRSITSRIRPALKALSDDDCKSLVGILETLTDALTRGHSPAERNGGGKWSRA